MPAISFSSGTVPQLDDSAWNLLVKQLRAINAGGGGGGGGIFSQIVAYTGADPNSDGVLPANPAVPAIAVKPGATTYTWSTTNHDWE